MYIILFFQHKKTPASNAQGPHPHILLMGGRDLRDSFGSEILAKRDFFGSMKDMGIFWVAKKTQVFFRVLYFSSAQINNNISAI